MEQSLCVNNGRRLEKQFLRKNVFDILQASHGNYSGEEWKFRTAILVDWIAIIIVEF